MQTQIDNVEEIFSKLGFHPTESQRKAICNTLGPQLIIAGPGSGKTEVLILRCLNLMLVQRVPANRILICTYTEKAAASLKDRVRRAIRDLHVDVDLTELWIGTIHSICSSLIDENITSTWLSKGYEVLDNLTQQLFLFENFFPIIGSKSTLGKGKWPQIHKAIDYFTKITEDMIDINRMLQSKDPRLESIARKYKRYEEKLKEKNSVDFAHLQSIVLELLNDTKNAQILKEKFDYVLVDEYQDTNYIQERIFLSLSEKTQNTCVVGDDDQALYRFRGAVVENFLNFADNFKNISVLKLEENFRSTPQIVDFVNKYMADYNWHDEAGKSYRYEKSIRATRTSYPNFDSVYSVSKNSGERIAKLIKKLQETKTISDLNQVAILLRSVAYDGKEILTALDKYGVKYYASRARGFFNLPEIKAIIGSLLYISDFVKNGKSWNEGLTKYYAECLDETESLGDKRLVEYFNKTRKEILTVSGSLKKGIVDVFYEMLAYYPFQSWVEDPIKGRNIAIFSNLLTKFQEYYHLFVISAQNWERLRKYLFNSFLYSMREIGLDEYEDPFDVFPPGYVQVMTIHQAKGLEFPVVIVSSLDKGPRTSTKIDRELDPFRPRKRREPWNIVGELDHRRLYYVAFSRAMDLLLLADDSVPHPSLQLAVSRAPELSAAQEILISKLRFRVKEFLPPKPEFSITGHINAYNICPRQYKYYKEYEFASSRSAGQAFGLLVHYTIEDIHRQFLKTKNASIDESQIQAFFMKNERAITRGGAHPLGKIFIDMAYEQVMHYYEHNKHMFAKLVSTEEPILVERQKYVMSGIIDLIRGERGQLELLDFKAEKKEDLTEKMLEFYKFQLSIYARMIERKLHERPKGTYIYLTAEDDAKTALLSVSIDDVEENKAEHTFDEIAEKITHKDFTVTRAPPRDVCRNCDFRHGCSDRRRFYPSLGS